jgi:DNA-binding response OmpR family regulator
VVEAMDGLEAVENLQRRFDAARALIGEGSLPDPTMIVERRAYVPDIILMDVMMPNMGGHEAVRRIRSMLPLIPIPIIMVSAKSREENIVEGLECGANDYLTKPVGKHELLARISTQLRVQDLWRAELERDQAAIVDSSLPAYVLADLKEGRVGPVTYQHEKLTILLSNIVGLNTLFANAMADQRISTLNSLYQTFDELAEKHQVYRVENFADGYMAVSGHDGQPNHTEKMLQFASAIISATSSTVIVGGGNLQLRVGVHSGPAVSGIVGVFNISVHCFAI